MMTDHQDPARCLRCGRALRATVSVTAGFGPVCRSRIAAAVRDADAAAYSATQRDKAAELVSDAGIIPTSRPGVWRVAGSDGTAVYLTTPHRCTCPAGQRGRARSHRPPAGRRCAA